MSYSFHPDAEAEFLQYGVLYSERENQIYILAVMHLHREPTYWQDRTS